MPHREDNFAIVYTGFIYVPENGVYSIYSNSDDGSKVFINDQLVVNNDGLHGARLEYVSMNLTKGYYAVRVEYFDRELDHVLEVGYWTDHSRSMPFGFEIGLIKLPEIGIWLLINLFVRTRFYLITHNAVFISLLPKNGVNS